MDARIQQSVVANLSSRPAPVEAGPFVLGLDPGTPSTAINYATPRPGAAITAADVEAMVAAFRAAGRKPRLEYVTATAPGLEALLLAAGFTVEERHDYLICTPTTLTVPPVPDGYTLRHPATDAECAAMVSAQNEAFGGAPVATEADIARTHRLRAQGGVAVLAYRNAARNPGGTLGEGGGDAADQAAGDAVGEAAGDGLATGDAVGEAAGGGQAVPPRGGVSEVAGNAVREPHRRRGLAGAITAEVTRTLFAAGVEIAWLEASGEDSWRVYERIGYRATGKRLYIALE
jgi:ribosomal protein S18 acetylase RimI-like enzyme